MILAWVSSVVPLARTAAIVEPGGPEQPDYLNTVVLASTTLSPREVLAVCQDMEDDAGRVRTEPQGPRTLDVDVITYEGVTSDDPELVLPHPRAAQRARHRRRRGGVGRGAAGPTTALPGPMPTARAGPVRAAGRGPARTSAHWQRDRKSVV